MSRRPLQRIQAITVARRYFVERQTKSRIAGDLAISRFKVARLISTLMIAGGLEKADAILAALRGNWITTLVTDAGVARRLLA